MMAYKVWKQMTVVKFGGIIMTVSRPHVYRASYVTVSFKRYNFRFSVAEMLKLKTEYFRQKNNKMHWDE